MKSIKQMAADRKGTQVANKKAVTDAIKDGDDFLNEGINQKKTADQKLANNRKQTEAFKKGTGSEPKKAVSTAPKVDPYAFAQK